MIKTCIFYKPGTSAQDLIRVGALYLSRNTSKREVYSCFMKEDEGLNIALNSAVGQPMHSILLDFQKHFLEALQTFNFTTLPSEEDIVEAAFAILPPNFKHDNIEGYPPEDFLVKAFSEAVVEFESASTI